MRTLRMNLPELYVFRNATKLISGRNALAHVAHELSLFAATRPMIVSDPTLESLGHIEKVARFSTRQRA